MAYLGLARKWRPKTFDDLVGQNHIARTVSNAIKTKRIHSGYLFTGTRGIGKTSSARIFAKALRCLQTTSPGVPCNKCEDCIEISEGRSVNVLEIDGASNNGVDAVREIRDNAKYLPSSGHYKIYIIDEVHMLTTAAFNALLKTLEEPPAHVVFIFATTDPQKIPPTVLSRCQRFDFKRATENDLKTRLKFICEAEGFIIDNEALDLLAREADGSMRDGISLLDQILSGEDDKKISVQTITQSLGLIDKQTVYDCLRSILERKPLRALEEVGKVYQHGFDLKQFGREILRMLRQLMVVQLLNEGTSNNNPHSQFIDISDVDLKDLKSLCNERSNADLGLLFRMLNHSLEDIARSSNPKIMLDVLVLKMASTEDSVQLNQILPQHFEKKKTSLLGNPSSTDNSNLEKAQNEKITQNIVATITSPSPNSPNPSSQRNFLQSALAALDGSKKAAATNPPTINASHKSDFPTNSGNLKNLTPPSPLLVTTPLPSEPIHFSLDWWKKLVAAIKGKKPMIGSILEHLSFESAQNNNDLIHIQLGFSKDHSFYKDQLQSRAYSDQLSQLLKNYLGRAARLDYKEVLANKSLEAIEQEQQKNHVQEQRRKILESEALKAVQQLLGARLEKLEIKEVKTEA